MPIVLLIRHGENEYARRGVLAGRLRGVHLNENGPDPGTGFGRGLDEDADPGRVFKSPRARQRDGRAACSPAAPPGPKGSGTDRKRCG